MRLDLDLEYAFHHASPMMMSSLIYRLGSVFDSCIAVAFFMEVGNCFAHTAAILTFRQGKLFHQINTFSFWISRPISFYSSYRLLFFDVPAENRFTIEFGLLLAGVTFSYAQQFGWMYRMIFPRHIKKGGLDKIDSQDEEVKIE